MFFLYRPLWLLLLVLFDLQKNEIAHAQFANIWPKPHPTLFNDPNPNSNLTLILTLASCISWDCWVISACYAVHRTNCQYFETLLLHAAPYTFNATVVSSPSWTMEYRPFVSCRVQCCPDTKFYWSLLCMLVSLLVFTYLHILYLFFRSCRVQW